MDRVILVIELRAQVLLDVEHAPIYQVKFGLLVPERLLWLLLLLLEELLLLGGLVLESIVLELRNLVEPVLAGVLRHGLVL